MDPLPPGPTGNTLSLLARQIFHPAEILDECAERYGDPFTLRQVRRPTFVVHWNPAAAKEIVTADPEVLQVGDPNALFEPVLGTRSLLLLDGKDHLAERRLMLPPFHGERMRAYGDLMAAVAERTIATWPVGRPFAAGPSARGMALEVIGRAVFGVDDEERLQRLGRKLRRLLDSTTPPWPFFPLFLMTPSAPAARLWRRYSPEIRPVDKLVAEEIARRRADPAVAERADIMSMLVATLDDTAMRDELMTLLVAGHETRAIALAWALVRLARDRAMAERAAADDDYLDAVIHETLRVHSIFPFSSLRAAAAPVEIGGRTYPAGPWHAVSSYLIHKRPEI